MRPSLHQMLTRSAAAAAISLGVLTSASGAFAAQNHTKVHTHATSMKLQGIVLSADSSRHTLDVVVGTGASAITVTLRFPAGHKVDVGSMIWVHVIKLADGTYRANSLHVGAKAHAVHVRATVVAKHGHSVELSSGGSVFTVSHDSHTSNVQVGDEVEVTATVQGSTLDETSTQEVGTSGLIGLDGTLSAVSTTSITLNVEDGASTTVAIPSSLVLPSSIAVGDRVELLVDYANQTFTLVTIVDDQAAANNDSSGITESDQNKNSSVQIEGLVTASDATTLTVQPGDNAAAVVVTIPSSITLAPLTVGARVHVVADMVTGVLTLERLHVQRPEGGQSESMTTKVEGTVVSVNATSLVIQPSELGAPVTFVVPSTTDVTSITVSAQIQASGVLNAGVLTLTKFELQGQEG